MEIEEITEKQQLMIDDVLKYFLKTQRGGYSVNLKEVYGHIVNVLKQEGCIPSEEYVLERWDKLLREEAEKVGRKRWLSPAERHKKIMEEWKIAKLPAVEYIKTLREPPKIDVERARKIVDDDVLSQFVHNGRAFDNDLKDEERIEMRNLEEEGVVRIRRFEITIKVRKGRKTNYKPYRVWYWEPAGIKLEKKSLEDEKYEIYQDDELWKKINGGRA